MDWERGTAKEWKRESEDFEILWIKEVMRNQRIGDRYIYGLVFPVDTYVSFGSDKKKITNEKF